MNGDVTVTLRLWNAESDGTDIWEDTFTNVPVLDGYYSVKLGSEAPLDSGHLLGGDRYLQIVLNGEPLPGRTQLIDVPYAAVAGSVALGPSTVCDAGHTGVLRFQDGEFSGCDGTEWVALSEDDTVPDPLFFPAADNALLGELAVSTPVALSGISEEVLLTVSGEGGAQIRAAGGPWGSVTAARDGDAIEVRLTTPPDGGATRTASVFAAGTTVGSFAVTTSLATTCDVLFQDGYTDDGNYLIDADGNSGSATRLVPCDMNRAGAGWAVYDASTLQSADWQSVDPAAIVESTASYRCDEGGSCENTFTLPYDTTEWIATFQVGDSTGANCQRARWEGNITTGDVYARFGRTSSGVSNSTIRLFATSTTPSPQFDQSRKRLEVHWTQGVDLAFVLTDIDSGTTWTRTDANTTSTSGSTMQFQWASSDTRCGSWRNADRRLVIDEIAFR